MHRKKKRGGFGLEILANPSGHFSPPQGALPHCYQELACDSTITSTKALTGYREVLALAGLLPLSSLPYANL
jgi:hypothetical protein